MQKIDIKTKKDRCGTPRHFNNKCCDFNNIFLQIQSVESMQNNINLEGKLWEKKKYQQYQLSADKNGANNVSDL